MPPLPNVPQTVRIDLTHTEAGDPGLSNRTFFRYSGTAPSATDLNTMANDLAALWPTALGVLVGTDIALIGITITDLTSPTANRGIWTGSHDGSRSGNPVGINTCALLNFTINRRYRGGKPRTYNPWGTETDLDTPQTWASAFIAAAHAGWTTWVNAINGLASGGTILGDQVNVSYYEDFASYQNPVTKRWKNVPTPRTTAVTDTVTGYALNPRLGSQRRRVRA